MSIENTQRITLDFCRNNIQSVSVKQYDKNTRYLIVTCTENGKLVKLDKSSMTCRVKVLTPDDRASLDTCTILDDGTVKVPLTENVLFSSGVANAELMIISSDESKRIGTMKFRVIIDSSVYGDERVISSDEFSALTELFEKADKDYTKVIAEAKKSADAAKVSESNAKKSETNASTSATNAKNSETNAKASETNAASSATKAKTSETNASNSEKNAKTSEVNAKSSETKSKTSETNASASATSAQNSANTATSKASEASASATNAKNSATASATSASNAKTSEDNAKASATKAKASEEQSAINATASDNSQREALQSVANAKTAEANALSHANDAKTAKDSASDYAKLAQSYANGSSGTRTNEETDNAKYYSNQAKSVSNSIPTYIKQIENAGDSQISRINEALTNASVNFTVDLTTGHLMYEGTNKLNFSVNNNGHLEWEVVSL